MEGLYKAKQTLVLIAARTVVNVGDSFGNRSQTWTTIAKIAWVRPRIKVPVRWIHVPRHVSASWEQSSTAVNRSEPLGILNKLNETFAGPLIFSVFVIFNVVVSSLDITQ